MPTLEEAFGKTLRAARSKAGLSQEELAHRANLHASAISFLERGLRKPTLYSVFAIAKVLDIPPSEFIAAVEKKRPRIETVPVYER